MLQDIPKDTYKLLIEQYLPALELKTLRLVSKECRAFIDTTVTALKPRDFSKCQVTRDWPDTPEVSREITRSCVCLPWPNLGITYVQSHHLRSMSRRLL